MQVISRDVAIRAWHFAPRSLAPFDEPGVKITAQKPLCASDDPVLRKRGLRGCEDPLEALVHARGTVVSETLHWGKVLRKGSYVYSELRVHLWLSDAEQILHQFAIRCGERALERLESGGKVIPPEVVGALDIKRKWLAGKAGVEQLQEAYEAALHASAWGTALHAAATAAGPYAITAAASAAWHARVGLDDVAEEYDRQRRALLHWLSQLKKRPLAS